MCHPQFRGCASKPCQGAESEVSRLRAKSGDFAVRSDNLCVHTGVVAEALQAFLRRYVSGNLMIRFLVRRGFCQNSQQSWCCDLQAVFLLDLLAPRFP